MKNKKKTVLVLAAVVAGLTLALALIVGYMMMPTRGLRIEPYASPRKALLLIDIQEDFTGRTARPPLPYKNAERLIAAANVAIGRATEKDMLVVYVRQEYASFFGRLWSRMFTGGAAIKGSLGAETDSRIIITSADEFTKWKGDAFVNPALDAFLRAQQVDELFLAGLDAEYCVHLTAKGALNRGYRVNILKDAIALRAEKKWDALMAEYGNEGINLTTSDNI